MSLSRPEPHARAAARFVRDRERTKWHDQTVGHHRARRDAAAAELPEWEALRDVAEKIKAHAIAHLGRYLREFEAAAQRNGVVVHFAADAEEHNRIVCGILRRHRATRVVKSKSMLTEECGLNPYLAERGIEVVDTDLGERIVQLRREPPSHITAPAIHLRKEEVAALFEAELGTEPGNADPTYLTQAARRDLRRRFLAADAAITGANFAVAETGGVVVVTNEGNADLGCALPKLHIACFGLEKVVPRLDDLGVLVRLLARSATGQAISVYTSHFHKARPDGELHFVIVDNGRTKLLAGGEVARTLRCIRCGACLNTCPVYRKSGGHSYGVPVAGPIGSVLSAAREPERRGDLAHACSLCGSCSDVCPVKIDLHHQLLHQRREQVAANAEPPGKKVLALVMAKVLSNPRLYAVAGAVARGALRIIPSALLRAKFLPYAGRRDLPDPPSESFRAWYRRTRGE